MADDRVFVVTRSSEEGAGDTTIHALDRISGRELWSRTSNRGFPSTVLGYGAGRVIAMDGSLTVRALSARSGDTVWSADVGPSGGSSYPVVANGVVYVGTGEGVVALDLRSGVRLWRSSGFNSTVAVDSERVYSSGSCPEAMAFRRADGVRVWHRRVNCSGSAGLPPAVFGGRLYVRPHTSGDVLDPADGSLLDTFSPGFTPAFAHGVGVFVTGTSVRAQDSQTGRVLWSASPVPPTWAYQNEGFALSPTIVGHRVYILERTGILRVRDLESGRVEQALDFGRGTTSGYFDAGPGMNAGDGTLVVPTKGYTSAVGPGGLDTAIEAAPDEHTSERDATFTFAATDRAATFECRTSAAAAWVACQSPFRLSGLADGEHEFEVRAVKGATADPIAAARVFTVDTVAPDTKLDRAPASPTRERTGVVRFSSGEAYAGFECRLDDGAYRACSTGVSFSDLSDGDHRVDVRAVDQAGNRDPVGVSARWTVDTQPPAVEFDSGPPSWTWKRQATFTFSSEPDVSFACRLDSVRVRPCTSPLTVRDLSDGYHDLEVTATDAAGNSNYPVATYGWHVYADAVPPDADEDGIDDVSDNCPAVANPSQADSDRDQQGDACDADDDGDGIADLNDLCPRDPAPGGCPAVETSSGNQPGGLGPSSGDSAGGSSPSSSPIAPALGSPLVPASAQRLAAAPAASTRTDDRSLLAHHRAFVRALRRRGAGDRLLGRGLLGRTLALGAPATVSHRLELKRSERTMTVAAGSRVFREAGSASVGVTLTRVGRRWLRGGASGPLVFRTTIAASGRSDRAVISSVRLKR